MSPTFSLAECDAMIEVPVSEQRLHRRYTIRLQAHYKVPGNDRSTQSGSGTVLNISSGGLFFVCKQSLPLRAPIRLKVKWPVLLDGVCPLMFLVRGHVVRSGPAGVAVRIVSYDFHTTKHPVAKVEAPSHDRASKQTGHSYRR